MYWPVQRARLQVAVRDGVQMGVGTPLESALMMLWKWRLPGADSIEAMGLPRRAIERLLGDRLVIKVNPGDLIRIRDWRKFKKKEHPSSNTFIWTGDWDQRWNDFRESSRSRFIRDIDENRHHLKASNAYQRFLSMLEKGEPWRSHQQGVLLDTEKRIIEYLRAYIGFLDDMAEFGFNKGRGKDELGVAITREGRFLKLNRGLHRLAMAQHLGLSSIPVSVKAVHRDWWVRVTGDTYGQAALSRVAEALAGVAAEVEPGCLDPVSTIWSP